MKAPYGYLVGSGYKGYVPWLNRMILFATETEYIEYLERS